MICHQNEIEEENEKEKEKEVILKNLDNFDNNNMSNEDKRRELRSKNEKIRKI